MLRPDYINEQTWRNAPWYRKLDLVASDWLPGWVIGLAAAAFFGVVAALGVASVLALAAWDASWYWSITSRAIFGTVTLVCAIIVWSSK